MPAIPSKKAISDPLIDEARKYKSADEFVKAQSKWLHGTPANFKEFDLSHFGKSDNGFLGKGVYLTNDKQSARYYADKWTSKAYPMERKGNVIRVKADIKKPLIVKSYDEVYRKLGLPTQKETGLTTGEYTHMYNNQITEKAQKMGFDSIIVNDKRPNGSPADELIVFDTKNLKTESQLTDIWNKVNEKTLGAVQEASEAKTGMNLLTEMNDALSAKDITKAKQILESAKTSSKYKSYIPTFESLIKTFEKK